jgi:hypothetical protein
VRFENLSAVASWAFSWEKPLGVGLSNLGKSALPTHHLKDHVVRSKKGRAFRPTPLTVE